MMRRLLRLGRIHKDDGQATFEFALLIPVFVVAVLMIVDGGVWMYKFVTVSNAVRDAARYGSVNCGADGPCTFTLLRDKAKESSSGFLNDGDDWTIHWVDRGAGDPTGVDKGDSVVVGVHQSHKLLFFPFTFGVASCAEMRLEAANGAAATDPGGC